MTNVDNESDVNKLMTTSQGEHDFEEGNIMLFYNSGLGGRLETRRKNTNIVSYLAPTTQARTYYLL